VKKGLIAILIIVALVVLLSPGIIGRIAEESVDESLQWAADENEDIVVTPEHFDRGWFSSEGRHRIEIRDPDAKAAIRQLVGGDAGDGFPTLVIETTLDHGLIPVTSMARDKGSLAPGLGRGTSTMYIEFPDGETFPVPGTIYSDIGLDGVVAANYIVEPGSHEIEDARASWGAASVEFSMDPAAQNAEFTGSIDSITVDADGNTLQVGRTEFSGNQQPTRFGIAVGDFNLTMDAVGVKEPGAEAVTFGPLSMSGSSSIDGDRVNGDADMSIAGVAVPGYGDMGLDIAMRFSDLDGASLGRVVQVLEAADDDIPAQQLFALLEDDLQQLVSAGFELTFDQFDFDLPQGPVTSKMRFTVKESGDPDFDWTSVLLDLDAEADLVVAAEFVDFAMATNPQAGAVVGMGFLRKNGDVYEMRAEYAKGLLTVNGAPMPIPLGN
jgi:uncharacterized protein YdgA (DUF945 family)